MAVKPSILREVTNFLGLQSQQEILDGKIEDKIKPVFVINNLVSSVSRSYTSTASGSLLVYTTGERDFYLTSIFLGLTKDVVSDNIAVFVLGTVDGNSVRLACILTQTLTAGTWQLSREFNSPIKIDRNTSINIEGTFAAGTFTRHCTIFGFVT